MKKIRIGFNSLLFITTLNKIVFENQTDINTIITLLNKLINLYLWIYRSKIVINVTEKKII